MTFEAHVVTDIHQVTPQWLTTTLRSSSALTEAHVTEVHVEALRETHFSIVARLNVIYSQPVNAPSSFFLKFSHPQRRVSIPENGREVVFYQLIAPKLPIPPVVCCFQAVFDQNQNKLHLLLEDLSETHYSETPSHLPPTYTTCEMIVQALAYVHAAFWEKPPFSISGQNVLTEQDIYERVQVITHRTRAFMEMLGDRLGDDRRRIYDNVLRALPRLFRRLMTPRGMTVVHDDIHIGNFLYPYQPEQEGIRIIDWQTWNTDLALKDLAHMMAYFWFPERRSRFETQLLRYYHACLESNGIIDYDWQELYDDYRFCVIRKLFHPVWQWETGDNATKWWFHLERIMLAYQDLDCWELLFK